MELAKYSPDLAINFPVSGGLTDIVRGALMRKGATPATMNGQLRVATGNNANADSIGIIRQPLTSTATTDTDVAGTVFTLRPVDLIIPFRVVRIQYSTAAADLIAATQAVTGTTITLTSLENDIDAAFLYVVSGDGAGQTNYLTASAAGSATLKAAFGTNLSTNSRLIKILPRFHTLASLNTAGTQLSSQDIVGTWRVVVLETWYVNGNDEQRMNPTSHDALTGLNTAASVRFEADIAIVDSITYPID